MIKFLRANKNFILGLFLFSFLIRALVFVGYLSKNENYFQVDSKTYNTIAIQIAKGKGISLDDEIPNFYRLPGYPIFLSLYYKAFGADSKNVLWLQIFFASFIPILVFLLSLALFPQNIFLAKVVGIYTSIHLGFILYSGFFMSESIFILLLLIFLVLFLSSIHLFFCPRDTSFEELSDQARNVPFRYFALPDPIASSEPYIALFEDMFSSDLESMAYSCCYPDRAQPTSPFLFCSGIALGLASLVRPVGHYLIVLTALLVFLSNRTLKLKIRKLFVTFLGWLIPVIFWLARNYILTGAIFFHTLPGGHFLYLSASRVAMHKYNCSYQEARNILKVEVEQLMKSSEKSVNRPLSDIEKCRIHENLALEYFRNYPFLAIKNWITDVMRTSLSLYSAELLYLESGKKEIDYFNKNRSIDSMFSRYLFPQTDKLWLRVIIWLEILLYLFILIGLFIGGLKIIVQSLKNWTEDNKKIFCAWLISAPFIALFLIISLSGGYARMRLPIEPFLIILSLSFWLPAISAIKNKL